MTPPTGLERRLSVYARREIRRRRRRQREAVVVVAVLVALFVLYVVV